MESTFEAVIIIVTITACICLVAWVFKMLKL